MKRLFLLDLAAGFERNRYIPQKSGKVKRFDREVERFGGRAVLSLKETRSLAVNNGAGRG